VLLSVLSTEVGIPERAALLEVSFRRWRDCEKLRMKWRARGESEQGRVMENGKTKC
jgi:hypothetical protein